MMQSTIRIMQTGEIIQVEEEVEKLDLMVLIRGSMTVVYNETDPLTEDERVKRIEPQGYIYPIKSHDNQYMKCIKVN
jgi:hypothetical protein